MNALIVNYEFPPAGGGAGRATWHLCRELASLGVNVTVLASQGAQKGVFDLDGAQIHSLSIHRKSVHETGTKAILEFLLKAGPKVRKLIKEKKIDLVHYFFSVPTGLLSLVTGGEIPYIVSLRGGDVPGYVPGDYQWAHIILNPLNKIIMSRASKVVALSNDLGLHALNLLPNLQYEVIYNGVDTRLFSPNKDKAIKQDNALRVLSVCRLLKSKGIQYLLRAIAEINSDRIRLTIVGRGSYEPDLKRLAKSLDLNGKVVFTGPIPHEDLPQIYNQSDIFVVPTYAESFGQTFCEAMACGLPVVATTQGGMTEYIENGQNGFLVTPRDAGSLAKVLVGFMENPDLILEMGDRNIRKMRSHFSWAEVADQYLEIYRGVMNGTGSKR
jgi:glycosyltransferase involved in cell wall biosynthesis